MNYMVIPGLQKNGEVKEVGKTTGQIMDVVCNYHNITPDFLLTKKRHRKYVEPRQQFFYLCWYFKSDNLLDLSGKTGFNHATVIWARKVVMTQMEVDRRYQEQMEKLIEIIRT
ncbi:MAG: hypothetical protein KGY70_16945 [Bacteroidales bacterium]|nr:hypothetical protein [Bacteroidales bacterium]